MDQLIEDLKLWIDRQEAYGDKDPFDADILDRIRMHESETAKLHQQLTVSASKASAYDILRQAICHAIDVEDQDKITDWSLIFKVESLSRQLKGMTVIAEGHQNGRLWAEKSLVDAVKRADMASEQWNLLQEMWAEQQDTLADCQKDAARYRWIRMAASERSRYSKWPSRWRIEYFEGPNGWKPMQREWLDFAIDAAMANDERP